MPTYSLNNELYNIPKNEEKEFIKENSNAFQVFVYLLNGNKFGIPLDESKEFEKENPQAELYDISGKSFKEASKEFDLIPPITPEEKKDVTEIPEVVTEEVEESVDVKKKFEKFVSDEEYKKFSIASIKNDTEKRIFSDLEQSYDRMGYLSPNRKMFEFDKAIEAGEDVLKAADKFGLDYDEETNSIKLFQEDIELYSDKYEDVINNILKEKAESEKNPYLKEAWIKLNEESSRLAGGVYDILSLSGLDIFKQTADQAYDNAQKWAEESTRQTEDITGLIQEGKTGEAIGETILQGIGQIPQLTMLALGNYAGYTKIALGILGGTAATQKYRELDEKDLPEFNKILTSVLTGMSEVMFEEAGTVKILDNVSRQLKNLGEEEVRNRLQKVYSNEIERIAAGLFGGTNNAIREGASEFATELTNNIIDRVNTGDKKDLMSNTTNAFIIGALVGKGMSIPVDVANAKNYIGEKINSLPGSFPQENKMKATELLIEKDNIKKEEQKVDEAFKKEESPRIKKIDEELNNLQKETKIKEETSYANTKQKPEQISELEVRSRMGEETPLRQPDKELAGKEEKKQEKVVTEEEIKLPENVIETKEGLYELNETQMKQREEMIAKYGEKRTDELITDFIDINNLKKYNVKVSVEERGEITSEGKTKEQYQKEVIERSVNPDQLYEVYSELPTEKLKPWQDELLNKRVSKESFVENNDINNVTKQIQLSWFTSEKKGNSIDQIAQELSENTGTEVTPDMVTDFIVDNPGKLTKDTDIARIKQRYKSLTGKPITLHTFKKEADNIKLTKEEIEKLENIPDEKIEKVQEVIDQGEITPENIDKLDWLFDNKQDFEIAKQLINKEYETEPEGKISKPKETGEVSVTEGKEGSDWEVGQEREFKFDPNSTQNEGRFRLQPPTSSEKTPFKKGAYTIQGKKTDFIRRNKFKGLELPEGIQSLVGKSIETGQEQVQALRFNKGKISEENAKKWFDKNKDKFEFYQREISKPMEEKLLSEEIKPQKTISFEYFGEPRIGKVTEEKEGYIKVTDNKGIKHTIKEGDEKYKNVEELLLEKQVEQEPELAKGIRELAEKVRKGKINKLGGFRAGTGFDAVWDASLEVLAKTLEATADLVKAVDAAIKYIENTNWYKNRTTKEKEDFKDKFKKHINKELEEGYNNAKKRKYGKRFMEFENVEKDIKEKVTKEKTYYIPISNELTIEQGKAIINENGLEGSKSIVLDYENGMTPRVRIGLAYHLIEGYNEAMRTETDEKVKETLAEDAGKVADSMMVFGTELGQGVQAFRIHSALNKLTLRQKTIRTIEKSGQELNEEAIKELDKLLEVYDKATPGRSKFKALEDIERFKQRMIGLQKKEIWMAIWYANVLSGPRTHIKNFSANMANAGGEVVASMILNPKRSGELIKSLFQGYGKRGFFESAEVMKTGYSTLRSSKTLDYNIGKIDALELKKFKGIWYPLNSLKYVMRAMKAADVWAYHGLKNMRLNEMVAMEAISKGMKSNKEINAYVDKRLFKSKEYYEGELENAKKEGLTGMEAKLRAYELIEQKRPDKVSYKIKNPITKKEETIKHNMDEEASDFASYGTFNHKPEGTLGVLTDFAGRLSESISLRGVKPLKFVIPFTRIISNVTNRYLDWSPYGFVRTARGETGLFVSEKYGSYKKSYNKEERAKLMIKASLGSAAMTFLILKALSGDDDKFEITANGTDNRKKNYELMKIGWKPYTIKIGDLRINYQNTPMSIPFMIAGKLSDMRRYEPDSFSDENIYNRFINTTEMVAWNAKSYVMDMTFLKGMNEFMGILGEEDINVGAKEFSKFMKNSVKSFVIPNGYTQLARQIEHWNNTPMTEANNLKEIILRDTPIGYHKRKPLINALGEPVVPNNVLFMKRRPYDPIWDFIVEKQAWVGKPSMATTIFDLDTKETRKMTNDEYYEFAKIRGELIKKNLKLNLDILEKMSNEDVQDYMKTIKTNSTKIAKRILFAKIFLNKDIMQNEADNTF